MSYVKRAWPVQNEAAGDKGAEGGGGENEAGADALGTVEDQARRMGWVPEADFRGDKAKWTTAETFVKNGLESLPILRENNRKLHAQVEGLSKSVGEFKKMSDANFEKGYAKAKRELESKIEAAVEKGGAAGTAEAKAASKDLAELEGEKVKRETAAEVDPVFDGWVGQNAWYQDPEMRVEAETIAFKLRRKGDTSEGAPFLDKVKEKMKAKFPEKFGNPRRAAGSSVERSAGGGEGGEGGKKGWEHLPKEAKDAGERYVKQKLFKDKAAYAADYWKQN